ncbi:MAG: hypothetical protein ACQEQF_13010 [Bacillota bacterium]
MFIINWIILFMGWFFLGWLVYSLLKDLNGEYDTYSKIILILLGGFTALTFILSYTIVSFLLLIKKIFYQKKGDNNMNNDYSIKEKKVSMDKYKKTKDKYLNTKEKLKDKEMQLDTIDNFNFEYKKCKIFIEPFNSKYLFNDHYAWKAKIYKNDIFLSERIFRKISKTVNKAKKVADRLEDYNPIVAKIDKEKYVMPKNHFNIILRFWNENEKDRVSFYNLEQEKDIYINLSRISSIEKSDNYIEDKTI